MKFLTKLLAFALGAALFAVTISCTVDLLGQILPAKYWYLPALGTGAFDVGVVAWTLTLLHGVENSEQRTIAWIMLVVDFVGVAVTTVADVFFYDAARGLVSAFPAEWTRYIVAVLMGVILLNVAGWLAMHILHPKYIQAATGRGSTAIVTAQYAPPVQQYTVQAEPANQPPMQILAQQDNRAVLPEPRRAVVILPDGTTMPLSAYLQAQPAPAREESNSGPLAGAPPAENAQAASAQE